MDTTYFYMLIYIIEAAIIFLYSSNMFHSKQKKGINFIILFFTYVCLYTISISRNYALNIGAFVLANFIYLIAIYRIKTISALFHAIIATAIMGMTELIPYSIMPHFMPEFFSAISSLRNIVILTIISKTFYFVIMYLISQIYSNKYKKTDDQYQSSAAIIAVSFITLFVMTTLFIICGNAALSPTLDILISISSVLLLFAYQC